MNISKKEKELIVSWFKNNKTALLKSCIKRKFNTKNWYKAYDTNCIESILSLPNVLEDSVPILLHKTIYTKNGSYLKGCEYNNKFINIGTQNLNIYTGKYSEIYENLRYFICKYLNKLEYTSVYLPVMIKEEQLYKSGHLPSWKNELYFTGEYYLIPTSECGLANIKCEEGMFYCFTENFRKESGSRGKRDKDMIRTNQFGKIEIFVTTKKQKWKDKFVFMFNTIKKLLNKFNFTYRVVKLPCWDTGIGASLTVDFEIWMPYSKRWIEVSSLSYTGDYQNKFRNISLDKNTVCLNGTCLPLGRIIACLIEYGITEFKFQDILE